MENLTPIRTEWRKAKARAAQLCIRAGHADAAQKLRVCTMFHGDETLEELVELLFTPQGIEFMSSFNFPTLSIFRQFKKYDTQRLGVFIDAGEITLEEVQRVLLIGNTTATLKYSQTRAINVCALHGATAMIDAAGYSVVKVDADRRSKVHTTVKDHAFVR